MKRGATKGKEVVSKVKTIFVDNYPPADDNIDNLIRSRWWMNKLNTTYSINPELYSTSGLQTMQQRLFRQNRHHKKWVGMTTKKRELEIRHPGHARKFYNDHIERQRNKNTVSFFCRYVLAKKGRVLPRP